MDIHYLWTELLYCGSTNTDSKIYLAEFKQLGTTGLALQH